VSRAEAEGGVGITPRLMGRAIEIGCDTWVSWDLYREGAQSMRSDGESWVKIGRAAPVKQSSDHCLSAEFGVKRASGGATCGTGVVGVGGFE